jgi:hypothetical protein
MSFGGGGGGMEPMFAGEGKRFVKKEKREAFVEVEVVGRAGSSVEVRGSVAKVSDCEVWVRGRGGAFCMVLRLRSWSS